MKDIDRVSGQPEGRTCTKCGNWKPFSEFNKKVKAKFGVNNECRACQKESNRRSYEKCDKVSRYEKQKQKRLDNPEQRKVWDAAYRERNPDKVKESQARHYAKPDARERRAEYSALWAKSNPEKVREKTRKSQAKRNKNPEVRVHNAVGRAIRSALEKGGKSRRSTFSLLGYTLDELKLHLERQFQPGMTWDNYGEWHIDHKIPKVLFNFNTTEDIDFRRCWALSNLQPLWADENHKKKDRYDAHFQPSLAIAIPTNDNKDAACAAT